jgi:rod shape determining protein RodA
VKRFLLRFDWLGFAAVVALVAIGAAVLASAGAARGGAAMAAKWKSTLATAAVGFVLYFALAAVDYRKVLEWAATPAYAVSVALLVAVLAFGTVQFGGRRWLWFFQPSEFSKLCLIAFLAHHFGSADDGAAPSWKTGFRGFLAASAAVLVPCALILLEPDLGTALVLAPTALVMLLAAGVWRKGLVAVTAAGLVAVAAVLGAVHEAERPGVAPERREAILRLVPLRDHQISRVKTFLFPETDAMSSGYNLRQAVMTVGSGGLNGRGYGRGESIRRQLLPPMGVMNDFIFCVWAEEMGYLKGSLPLLALFALLCVATARAAARAGDGGGRLLALGVATLLFAHVYVNIGMSVGLMPITGLPLPFLSLGRTFLVTAMCALGMVQSVAIHGRSSE